MIENPHLKPQRYIGRDVHAALSIIVKKSEIAYMENKAAFKLLLA